MNLITKQIYSNKSNQPNTFIGGVASTFGTPALIAAKLGISVSRVTSFTIVGNNIQFKVTSGTYSMPNLCWYGNTSITYYNDAGNLVVNLVSQSFRNCSNLTYLNLNGVTTIDIFSLAGLTALQVANFTSCTNFNAGGGNFTGIPLTCVITAPLVALTNGVDGKPSPGLIAANCIVNYVGYVDDGSWNTEIKGVATTDNSRLLIGRRIGCSPAALLNFQIIGSDIRFKVYGTYTLAVGSFLNRTDITAYNDNSNLVVGLGSSCMQGCTSVTSVTFNGIITLVCNNQFRAMTSLTTITMDNLTTISGNYLARDTNSLITFHFANLINWNTDNLFYSNLITNIYAPKLMYLGTSALNNNAIGTTLRLNVGTITVSSYMQTSNAGAEEGDIAYCRTTRGATIVYV